MLLSCHEIIKYKGVIPTGSPQASVKIMFFYTFTGVNKTRNIRADSGQTANDAQVVLFYAYLFMFLQPINKIARLSHKSGNLLYDYLLLDANSI